MKRYVDKVEPEHVVPARTLKTQPELFLPADHEAFADARAIHDTRDRIQYLRSVDDRDQAVWTRTEDSIEYLYVWGEKPESLSSENWCL